MKMRNVSFNNDWKRVKCIKFLQHATVSALPSPGFYPEISGFFEAVGIFLGFLF